MLRSTLALGLLIVILALPYSADAARKKGQQKPPAPSVASYLTSEERACRFYAEIAAKFVTWRDKGLPLTTALSYAREIFVSQPEASTYMTDITHALYADVRGLLTPAKTQQLIEVGCLTPASTPSTASQRIW